MMPLGLRQNKLALPKTHNVPLILDEFVSVTRMKIFVTSAGL